MKSFTAVIMDHNLVGGTHLKIHTVPGLKTASWRDMMDDISIVAII